MSERETLLGCARCAALLRERDEARARLHEARIALAEYAMHKPGCYADIEDGRICTCGMDAAHDRVEGGGDE